MDLKYRKDGTFRIMQVTDTHVGEKPYNKKDQETFKLIKKALEKFDVDLIIHTGDIIWSQGIEGADVIFKEVIEAFNAFNVPLAITIGNHDAEGEFTRKELRALFENNALNKAKKHDVLIHDDRESYTLPILSNDQSTFENILYVMDTGALAPLSIGLYDWNQPEQVEWFKKTAEKYKKGDKIKRNLVFQHIPVPEYWDAMENIIDGVNEETNEAISAPHINTGLFANMLINGEFWGMFVGHDHENDFEGLHHGIHLVYGSVSGFNSYGGVERGIRIIELNNQTNEINTQNIKYTEFKS